MGRPIARSSESSQVRTRWKRPWMSPTPTMRAVSLMARALDVGPGLTRLAAHVRARRHLHPGRLRAQPQIRLPRRAEEGTGGLQRGEREREELARLRHPL